MPLYAFNGHQPTIGEDCWVAPSADLIGEVRLGREVGIWFGVVIRADNGPISVGERSNVQEGTMCHSDEGVPLTIGAGCTIGHHAMLHGCTIGNNVLVGMKATVLNHAVIPENCLIGAGALVTEGKTFESGSLIVGTPARAVRRLSAEQIDALRQSAGHYVARQRAFSAGLARVG